MIQELTLYYKRLGLLQKYALYLWSFCVFFPALNFIGYVFISLSLIKLLVTHEYQNITFSKNQMPYFFLIGFIGWNIFSLSYSEDLIEGIKQVEKKLPILLVVVVGLLENNESFDFKKVQKFNFYGAIFGILLSLAYVLYLILIQNYPVHKLRIMDFMMPFEHPLYFGMVLMMTIPFVVQKIIQKPTSVKTVLFISILCSFLTGIYFFGPQILFAGTLLILFIILGIKLKPLIFKNKFSFCVISIVFISIIFFHNNGYFSGNLYKTYDVSPSFEEKMIVWNRAVEIMGKHSILGVGMGDYQDELMRLYKINNDTLAIENKWNAHNQYLQVGLETGLIGLILFALFFLSIFFIKSDKLEFVICFYCVFGLGFLSESVLSRNLGTFPFSFWIFILLSVANSKNSSTNTDKSLEKHFFDNSIYLN